MKTIILGRSKMKINNTEAKKLINNFYPGIGIFNECEGYIAAYSEQYGTHTFQYLYSLKRWEEFREYGNALTPKEEHIKFID